VTRNHEAPGRKKAPVVKATDPGVTVKIDSGVKTLLDAAIPHDPKRRGMTVKAVVSALCADYASGILRKQGVPAPVI